MDKAEVIENLIEAQGYPSKRAFAEHIQIPPTTLQSMLTRGVGKASIDNVIKVCRGLNISVEDLERMASDNSTPFEAPLNHKMKVVNKEPCIPVIKIPFYSSISAGALASISGVKSEELECIELPTFFLERHINGHELMAFKVNGESMNLVFPHGSTIVAKKLDPGEVREDDIVVYSYDGEYAVKRYHRDEEDEVLVFSPESANKKFRDTVIPFDTQADLRIHAKVIWYGVSI